jgi:hypothetical protein
MDETQRNIEIINGRIDALIALDRVQGERWGRIWGSVTEFDGCEGFHESTVDFLAILPTV